MELNPFLTYGVNLVAACDMNSVIGKDGTLPWNIPEDLKHFKKITEHGIVIMGFTTWDSLKGTYLKDRTNVVLTTRDQDALYCGLEKTNGFDLRCGPYFAGSIEEVYEICQDVCDDLAPRYVIGGSSVYELFLEDHPEFVEKIYLNIIKETFEGDTLFPTIPPGFKCIETEDHEKFIATVWSKDDDRTDK